MNRVEIQGGLTRDAEFRFLPSGMPVAEWTMALNGTRYDSEQRQQVVTTTYVSVVAWGSVAESLMEDDGLHQGEEVHVIGELTQREVEKKDGSKERKTRVTAHVVHVVRRRGPRSSSRPSSPTPGDGFTPPPSAQQGSDPWIGG